jgi:phosphonate transport system substrate-binding protein
MNKLIVRFGLALLLVLPTLAAAAETYSFGVLPQRSPLLTAEYWNPILDHVSRRAGVQLHLKTTRTTPESSVLLARGEYDFAYSNAIFTPAIARQGYRVLLRPRGAPIHGQIITLEDSPLRTLADLAGSEVGFPSRAAFVAYAVPMDALLRQGIAVKPTFGGNQEGIMGQLKAGRVAAAGVNDEVMRQYAARENLRYRVLWESQPYQNLPIAAHPRVPDKVAEAVQRAFADMVHEAEGRRVLEASAAVIKEKPPLGFLPASQKEYQNYLDFYRHSLVKEIE